MLQMHPQGPDASSWGLFTYIEPRPLSTFDQPIDEEVQAALPARGREGPMGHRRSGRARQRRMPMDRGGFLYATTPLAHGGHVPGPAWIHRDTACSRRIVHFNVTAQPAAACTAQQFVEAFPEATAPKTVILRLPIRKRRLNGLTYW